VIYGGLNRASLHRRPEPAEQFAGDDLDRPARCLGSKAHGPVDCPRGKHRSHFVIEAERGVVPGYDQSVLGRARPEYAPSGVRVGSFNLLPSLSEGLGYDDNILGSSNGKRGSLLVDTRASLSANSDWSRDS
jgi:hypothetical protein